MVKCAVTTCSNLNDKKSRDLPIKFHRFPNNVKLKTEWLKLCGLADKTNTDNLRVCSNHFVEDLQHTLQCRLLGTSSNVLRKNKCGCRIPEGELPTLNLPFSKRKIILENKKAKVVAAQKEKERKALVEELLRSSSSMPGPSEKVTYKNFAPTVQFDPTATAKPPQKRKEAKPVIGPPPAKKPALQQAVVMKPTPQQIVLKPMPQQILPLLQQHVKILPKPPAAAAAAACNPAGSRPLLCLPKSKTTTSKPSGSKPNLQMRIQPNTMRVQSMKPIQVQTMSPMTVQSINPVGIQSNPNSYVLHMMPNNMMTQYPTSAANITNPTDLMTLPQTQNEANVQQLLQSMPSTSTDNMEVTKTTEIPQLFLMEDKEDEVLSAKEEEPMEVFSESEREEEDSERAAESPVDFLTPGTSTNIKLDELCRVCATPSEDMMYIFSPEGKSNQLQYKINLCLPITVTELDSLPLCVCKVCLLRLELSYKLAATCEMADNRLRVLENQLKSPAALKKYINEIIAMDFCQVEQIDTDNIKPTTKKPKPLKLVQRVASNKLPILCTYCDLLLCTTHDAVLHYLKLHQKSACEFCFSLFENNEELVKHLNASHIHKCKFCNFKIIGLGETLLKSHINNVHGTGKTMKKLPTKSSIKKNALPKFIDSTRVHKCRMCYLLYSSKITLKQHYISVHKKFICIACLKEFSSKDELETHENDEFHEVLCKYCHREFATNRGLHNHITMSHRDMLPAVDKDEKAEYECKICFTLFVNKRNLRRHYLKKHSSYGCSICEEYFSTKNDYNNHSKEKNHYTCEICDEDFDNLDTYKSHIDKHKIGSDFECQACNKAYSSKSALKLHIRYVHLNEPFKYPCPHCDKRCKTPRNLKLHLKRHQNEKNVKCDKCTKTFYDYAGLKTHSLVHIIDKKYVCDQCGKKFSHQRNLAAHIKGVHTANWIFTCNVCKHVQNNEENILTHCKTHIDDHSEISYTKTSPYYCDLCSKYFANKLYHLNHIRHHTYLNKTNKKEIIKPYECNVCLKKFISKQMLKRHFGTHLAIKPFNCTYCKRGFLEDKDLEIHVRIHTNERPFICTHCNKTFHKKANLLVHRKNVHENIRKIPCPYCEKLFKRHHHLTVHIRTHTHEKPYICDICQRPFAQQADLYRHKLRHEGIVKNSRKKITKEDSDCVDLTPLP